MLSRALAHLSVSVWSPIKGFIVEFIQTSGFNKIEALHLAIWGLSPQFIAKATGEYTPSSGMEWWPTSDLRVWLLMGPSPFASIYLYPAE
jgi:hypothetical protein